MISRLPGLALVVCVVTACGPADDRAEAGAAAGAFFRALAARDGARACALLRPEVASRLGESTGKPCARAVLEQELGGGDVQTVRVYTDEAQVRLADGSVAFLESTSRGWQVSAAGCRPRTDLPYDCQVEE